MRPRPLSPADVRRAQLALVVVALAAWLDHGRGAVAQQAGIFAFVIEAIVVAGEALGSAAAFVAVHLEAVVIWLISHVAWLVGYVGKILQSTGAMFARVWDSAKTFYSSVLKPFALEVWNFVKRVRDWLDKYLGPVYRWARRVRDELLSIYKRFVRPILDVIDFARAVLKTLADLGVAWAQALDVKLGQLESVITQNFLKILGELNKVINVVDSVVTLNGLFQRVPWLLTLKRDMGPVSRMLLAARAAPITELDAATINRAGHSQPAPAFVADVAAYMNGEQNDVGDTIDANVAKAVDFWESITS